MSNSTPHLFSEKRALTSAQSKQESSLFRAILLDLAMYIALIFAAVASGSLTIIAEIPRAGLLFSIEIIALVTMRRSNRGGFSAFEYGIGKIERVVSLLIVGGLFISAIFTVFATFDRLANPVLLPTPAMVLAVGVASLNLMINTYCTGDFVRSNQTESSLILASQISSRMVKMFASAVVVVVLVMATWLPDPTAANYIDVLGAVFIIGYMVMTGVSLLKESLPDLLDRALPENEQLLLMRVLTRYFDHFEDFGSIKSRRSGGRAFIEVELEFQPDMTLAVVNSRCETIRRDIVELIPDAFVSVIPNVANVE